MPPHSTYIETHLGGGAIMKRKPPALRNIGIDLNRRAIDSFSCDYPVELHHGCCHAFLSDFDFDGRELVWDLSLLVRERPNDPAEWHVNWEDITTLCVLAAHHSLKVPRGPPEMIIASFVVLTGGLADFHLSKHQPLPGTQKLWEGVKLLSYVVIGIRAMQDWDGNNWEEEENMNSSVLY